MNFEIYQLDPSFAPSLVGLRAVAIAASPMAFGSSPEDDRGRFEDFMRTVTAPGQDTAMFGIVDGAGALCGMVGVHRTDRHKGHHKANIWGMYVVPRARGLGLGRKMLTAIIDHTFTWTGIEQVQLSVTNQAANAHQLYTSLGFKEWGHEAKSLKWDGAYADEIYMVVNNEEWHTRK